MVSTQIVPPFEKGRLGGILLTIMIYLINNIGKNDYYKSSLTLLFQRRGLV